MTNTRATVLCPDCGRTKWRRTNGLPWKHHACWQLLPGEMGSGAKFSTDRGDRYRLWRRWNPVGCALWVLLNPSDGDEFVDDPTIDKLLMLTEGMGLGAFEVVNLDSVIESKSGRLGRFAGRNLENEAHIEEVSERADRVVLAWGGVDRSDRRERILTVLSSLRSSGWTTNPHATRRLECVAETSDLYPGHPQRRSLAAMTVHPWIPPSWVLQGVPS
jgi:hypothetical protein